MNLRLISQRVRGMQDILPNESKKWLALSNLLKRESKVYGFKLIRTPVLEHTEVFERSAGSTSDIVNKEMYTFEDKGKRSVTLRPEGTAGVLRAVLENGLHQGPLPIKLMYESSCYRYEKPQVGRFREFFQFGLEIFGTTSAIADAQLICLARTIIAKLDLKNVYLEINSIGCKKCRMRYMDVLKKYFESHTNELCDICIDRLSRNPLRIFDCKEHNCKTVASSAPAIIDYLCEDCLNYFNSLKNNLNEMDVAYTINPRIVRGLDYYSGSVFEFTTVIDGVSVAICGGGRYDGLSELMSGVKLPAVGLGFGMERLLAVMDKQGIDISESDKPAVYIAAVDETSRLLACKLSHKLRDVHVYAEFDISDKSLKSQMKYANKMGAKYIIVIGEDEIKTKTAILKDMSTAKEHTISLDDRFLFDFLSCKIEDFND